jgi:multidrug efflux pump
MVMCFTGIDLQRISLGALISALGLMVDDAMRLERGDDKERAASFGYTSSGWYETVRFWLLYEQ